MNAREHRYISYICLMVVLLLPLSSGCTRYHVVKGTVDCPTCTEVSVWSSREFEQPDLHYGREDGNVQFDFGAASATQATSPLEAIGAMALERMMNQFLGPSPITPPEQ